MAIDRTPVFKRCRYLGIDPILLGYTHKPSRRQRLSRTKPSAYALQLKEKQKVKFVYGVLERQFRRTFDQAMRLPGATGENLMRLLELRLDNVAFRLGYAKTRAEARQLVSHRHVLVNGRRVDIPSIEVKPGDVIGIDPAIAQAAKTRRFALGRKSPAWLEVSEESLSGRVLHEPARGDIDFDVAESKIVELYSK